MLFLIFTEPAVVASFCKLKVPLFIFAIFVELPTVTSVAFAVPRFKTLGTPQPTLKLPPERTGSMAGVVKLLVTETPPAKVVKVDEVPIAIVPVVVVGLIPFVTIPPENVSRAEAVSAVFFLK